MHASVVFREAYDKTGICMWIRAVATVTSTASETMLLLSHYVGDDRRRGGLSILADSHDVVGQTVALGQ